jgi:ComF family protein
MEKERKVYNWVQFVRYALYPRRCVLCGQPGHDERDLCRDCLAELPWNRLACRCCSAPLQTPAAICGSCLRRPPPFVLSQIPFRYESPLNTLLPQLKFQHKLHLAPLFADLLAETIRGRSEPLPQALLPVPLHPGRLRERGYNQALEIARPLSRQLAIPLALQFCTRQRHTQAQTSLSGAERRRNLRGAFAVTAGEVPRHVAIVDDVVTTGATVEELARTLRRAGVETVEVWACARA